MNNEVKAFSVTEVTRSLKNIIEENFFDFWVYGEISNFKGKNISGHTYFNLKDETAILPSVLFKTEGVKCSFNLSEGAMVLAHGRLSLYEPHGRYQFIIKEIRPWGVGELYIKFEALKNKLKEEGLFDEGRKQKLPLYPERIGVITSPTGAAIRDIINGFRNRYPCLSLIINPVHVQGEAAAREIADAIYEFNKLEYNLDFIIIARGGGSIEDLWAFNEETTARAIYESTLPVVSAVGHMTDYTISDFVADVRASTPSNAAEITTPSRKELYNRIILILSGIVSAANRMFTEKRELFKMLKDARIMRNPMFIFDGRRERLNDLVERFYFIAKSAIAQKKKRDVEILKIRFIEKMKSILKRENGVLDNLKISLYNLSPLNILSRGYSITRDKKGNILFDSGSVNVGDDTLIKLFRGELECTVVDRRVDVTEVKDGEKSIEGYHAR